MGSTKVTVVWKPNPFSPKKLCSTVFVSDKWLVIDDHAFMCSLIADKLTNALRFEAEKSAVVDEHYNWAPIQEEIYKTLTFENIQPIWETDLNSVKQMPVHHPKNDPELARLAKALPGVNEIVAYPCNCVTSRRSDSLMDVVIHLNDKHTDWDRNKIADWLESLDIDMEFKA